MGVDVWWDHMSHILAGTYFPYRETRNVSIDHGRHQTQYISLDYFEAGVLLNAACAAGTDPLPLRPGRHQTQDISLDYLEFGVLLSTGCAAGTDQLPM